MAIRFYCPFCDRLLGISDRRAGAVVACPQCGGKIGVPTANTLPAPPTGPLGMVLTFRQVWTGLVVCVAAVLSAFTVGLLIGAFR